MRLRCVVVVAAVPRLTPGGRCYGTVSNRTHRSGRCRLKQAAKPRARATARIPTAHAEEMYDQSLGGRSDGGSSRVVPRQ